MTFKADWHALAAADLLKACGVKTPLKDGDVLSPLPNGQTVLYRDSNHRYSLLDPEAGESHQCVSVTTVLSLLAKPALLHWVERLTREGKDWQTERNTAATRGTSIHAALEGLCADEVPVLDDYPEDDRGYVRAVASWWLTAKPEVVATEVIVAHPEELFAGRFDLLCKLDGVLTLCDLKTGEKPGLYVEHPLQLAGYARAMRACGMEVPDVFAILKVCPDGSYAYTALPVDEDRFGAVLSTYRALSATRKDIRAAEKAAA